MRTIAATVATLLAAFLIDGDHHGAQNADSVLELFERLSQDSLTLAVITHDEHVASRATGGSASSTASSARSTRASTATGRRIHDRRHRAAGARAAATAAGPDHGAPEAEAARPAVGVPGQHPGPTRRAVLTVLGTVVGVPRWSPPSACRRRRATRSSGASTSWQPRTSSSPQGRYDRPGRQARRTALGCRSPGQAPERRRGRRHAERRRPPRRSRAGGAGQRPPGPDPVPDAGQGRLERAVPRRCGRSSSRAGSSTTATRCGPTASRCSDPTPPSSSTLPGSTTSPRSTSATSSTSSSVCSTASAASQVSSAA